MDMIAVVSSRLGGLPIASAAALAGYDVVIIPLDGGPSADDLREAVRELASRRGLLPLECQGALGRLRVTPSLEAARDCGLVVECTDTAEPMARASLLRRLEAHMTFGAVLATEDPGCEALAHALARPTQFIAVCCDGDGFAALSTGHTAPGAAEAARIFCERLDGPAQASVACA